MRFDEGEQEKMEETLLEYYFPRNEYDSNAPMSIFFLMMMALAAVYMTSLVLLTAKLQPPWWVYLVLWVIFNLVFRGIIKWWLKKRRERRKTPGDIVKRLEEIFRTYTSVNDKVLFMRLINSIGSRNWDNPLEIVKEVSRSQTLSGLTFIRDVCADHNVAISNS